MFSLPILICVLFLVPKSDCLTYENIFKSVDSTIFELLTPNCQKDVKKISSSSTLFRLMAKSSGELTEFKLNHTVFIGNYDQCLAISAVQTKFCKTYVRTNENKMPFDFLKSFGQGTYVCVPNSCIVDDLNLLSKNQLFFLEDCSDGTKKEFDVLGIMAIIIFGLLALIILLSTIYDVWSSYSTVECHHSIFLAFSVYTNTKTFFLVDASKQLPYLNGLKSISTISIVIIHSFLSFFMGPIDNIYDFYNFGNSSRNEFLAETTTIVDIFFVIRGFLTAFSFVTALNNRKKFNLLSYYLHRYFRLTPALAAVVLLHAAVINYLGSGPFWKSTNRLLVEPCRQYWWTVIFYVQNYSSKTICAGHAWFLSIDMQLFLLSPILLFLIQYKTAWGFWCLSLLSFLSAVFGFWIGWSYELPATFARNMLSSKSDIYISYYYFPTYTRMTPFFLGIMLYYLIYKLKRSKKTLRIHTAYAILGWVLSFGMLLMCIFLGGLLESFKYKKLLNAIYIAAVRPIWAVAICWIVFACDMGFGGVVKTFLSLPVFQIFAKLSYSIYLIHTTLIMTNSFSRATPLHFSFYNVMEKICKEVPVAILLGFVWYLVFEAPFLIIDRVLFDQKFKSKDKIVKKIR